MTKSTGPVSETFKSRNDVTSSALSGIPSLKMEKDLLEPIAVVGLSLKFSQDAVSADGFWSLMEEKRCAMTEWPKDRLNIDAFHHPNKDRPNTVA